MRTPWLTLPLLILTLWSVSGVSLAQQAETGVPRKILTRVQPVYPDSARAIALEGLVKMDVRVAANGTVKSIESKGGHPLLLQAATSAVVKWKWEPSNRETREPVAVRFNLTKQ